MKYNTKDKICLLLDLEGCNGLVLNFSQNLEFFSSKCIQNKGWIKNDVKKAKYFSFKTHKTYSEIYKKSPHISINN